MKRVLSMILALMMVVGVLAVIPVTVGAAETSGWDGSVTTPKGSGREDDPYIIDEPGDLAWFQSKYSNAQIVNTLGYDGKIYAAQYEGIDMTTFNNSTFEATYTEKSIDYTKPMALYSGGEYDLNDTWAWGTKIYIKQVCDIDLNGKTIRPMCYYWRYSDGSMHVKGNFFCGEYDGQGYTIKNGTVKQNGANAAWTAGLFGVLWGATVKNIVFENFHSVGNNGTPGIGIIASRTLGTPDLVERGTANWAKTPEVAAKVGKSVVENIKVLGDCTVESKQYHDAYQYHRADWRYSGTGGIVGAVSNADIKSCVFLGTVYPTLQDLTVGGVVGLMGFGATVDGCYFGGKISYEKCTSATLAAETHIGGVVGSLRGNNQGAADGKATNDQDEVTNDASWPRNGAIKGTNIGNETTVDRGVNAITNCVNNGTMNLKATVDGTATTIAGQTVCNGGVLGATAQLWRGPSGSYTFSGNVNFAGAAAIPSMTRTGGVAGCFYNNAITDSADAGVNGNTSTVQTNMQKVIISDCHSVTSSTVSPGSYPATAKKIVGAVRNAACVEDGKCTYGWSQFRMLSIETVADSLYKVCNGFFQGEGTEENPWKIDCVADWDFFDLQMANDPEEFVQNKAFEGKYLVQTADLDFGGASRSPLASYQPLDRSWGGHKDGKHVVDIDNTKGSSFRGTYDGQGYAIKNLKLNGTARTNDNWTASGLFGSLFGATVKNIVLDNVDMTAPNGYSGLIAGITRDWLYEAGADYKGVESGESCSCENNSAPIVNYNYSSTKVSRNLSPDFNVIDGIIVKDTCDITITGTAGNVAVGSILGQAVAATVKNCYTAAQISYDVAQTEKHRGVGGVVGTMGVATSVINCIGDADIEYEITGVANKEYPFGGIVGAYDDGGVVESLANTTAGKLISGCVNMGSFHVSKAGTSMGCTVYYGGIVGGANYVDDTIGGRKIENCYNLSNDITIMNTTDAANPVAMTGMGNIWRIGGLVGCYWCANGTDKADSIEMVNVSTIDLSSINTNTYWNTYDGVICAYNRNVIDSGVTKKCFTITNDADAPAMSVASISDAKFAAAVKANMVEFTKGRDALHYYGAQVKDGANNSKSIRLIYDMEQFTEEELKFFKEIRFNVTMDGKTLTTSENTIYTSFLNYADGEAENLEATEGLKYMTALTISNVPNTGSYEMVVEAMLVSQDAKGAEFGIAKAFDVVININNGVVTTTSLGVAAN